MKSQNLLAQQDPVLQASSEILFTKASSCRSLNRAKGVSWQNLTNQWLQTKKKLKLTKTASKSRQTSSSWTNKEHVQQPLSTVRPRLPPEILGNPGNGTERWPRAAGRISSPSLVNSAKR